ncbi:MAG: YgjV family protein [Clostridia bacterium]|nr:YgjV family protein [Clostridia bacterium]
MKEFFVQLFGQDGVITTTSVLIQSVGWLALVCSAISFQQKKRVAILLWQATATLVSSIYLFLLGAYEGACLDLLSFVGKMIFSKGGAVLRVPLSVWRIVFLAAMLVAGVLTWADIYSLLAILASCLSVLALSMKNPTHIRIISLFVGPCWIVYNWIYHAYPSILMECIALTSIIIGIIRYDIKKKKENEI